MRHLIVGSLSLLLMSAATAPAIKAQPSVAVGPAEAGVIPSYVQQTTPFNLVYLAYQGYFKNQGIPSYGGLIAAYQSGKISVQDLVQVARLLLKRTEYQWKFYPTLGISMLSSKDLEIYYTTSSALECTTSSLSRLN